MNCWAAKRGGGGRGSREEEGVCYAGLRAHMKHVQLQQRRPRRMLMIEVE